MGCGVAKGEADALGSEPFDGPSLATRSGSETMAVLVSATFLEGRVAERVRSGWRRLREAPRDPLHAYFALFVASVMAFTAHLVLGPQSGALAAALAVLGGSTCGWSWLLARALFAPPAERTAAWPRVVVAAMIAMSLISAALAFPFFRIAGVEDVARMALNAHALASSTVLLLALIEPLRGFNDPANASDRRFRILFTCGYGALLAISVIWPRNAGDGALATQAMDAVRVTSAWLAVLGAALAVSYRIRRANLAGSQATSAPASAHEVDPQLRARLLAAMANPRVTSDSELKVPQLARLLRAPEYKVSRAIQAAGFANFNQMINHHRLERAKAMLSDTAHAEDSILEIAMACGFGSIGVFNRAFKAAQGQTPSQYRAAARRPLGVGG